MKPPKAKVLAARVTVSKVKPGAMVMGSLLLAKVLKSPEGEFKRAKTGLLVKVSDELVRPATSTLPVSKPKEPLISAALDCVTHIEIAARATIKNFFINISS